jgi:hypothetical protein
MPVPTHLFSIYGCPLLRMDIIVYAASCLASHQFMKKQLNAWL